MNNLDLKIESLKNSIARWKRYSDHWTEDLKLSAEKLKDQCLPEIQKNNIQDSITEAKSKISWAKENIERHQNAIDYYQGKTKQSPTSPASFKLAAIAAATKGQQGETGKPGGLGPIVKSKKCS